MNISPYIAIFSSARSCYSGDAPFEVQAESPSSVGLVVPYLSFVSTTECGGTGTPCHVIRGLIKNWKYVTNIKSAGDGSTKTRVKE